MTSQHTIAVIALTLIFIAFVAASWYRATWK
jgi:hypothetical protein